MLIINEHSGRVTGFKEPKDRAEYEADIRNLQSRGQIELAAMYRKHYKDVK